MTPLPTVSQSSATVNPYGCPACLRDGAPGHPAYGPGLERGMLTPPRCSKSRLHRQRLRAKFSLSLYRPLPDRGRTGRCEVSRGNHRLPSCSPTPIITCRAARLTCYVLTATLWRAPRYPRDEEGCALLPRHHAEPKELLSTDHFDATPPEVGMTLVTPRPSRVSARGASPHRCAFHLLRRDRQKWSTCFHHLATVTSRHAAGRAEGLPPPPHRRLTASAKAVIASACGVTTLGDPARVPHCKESWPLSGHERTRIGKTKLRPAVKQGEHAPFH